MQVITKSQIFSDFFGFWIFLSVLGYVFAFFETLDDLLNVLQGFFFDRDALFTRRVLSFSFGLSS
jgi:hypothetical protein